MNTNMTGFSCFSKIFASFALDESRLSIGRVKIRLVNTNTRGAAPMAEQFSLANKQFTVP